MQGGSYDTTPRRLQKGCGHNAKERGQLPIAEYTTVEEECCADEEEANSVDRVTIITSQ
jgi:hypothetical protein